jgi:formamidopyrimidine-DNA glycosylase
VVAAPDAHIHRLNTPAHDLPGDQVDELWKTSVALLRRGVREGKIITVKRARGKTEADRLYVYKRDRFPCRQCAGPISTTEIADRSIWWCEVCQPR